MPKCPECNKEIESLGFSSKVWHYGDFSIIDGNGDFDTRDYGDWENVLYSCPKCNETLFDNEKKAIEFLKGVD